MYFDRSTSIDTFSYRLDKKQKSIFLREKNKPSNKEQGFTIILQNKKKQITITGLFITVGSSSVTMFTKE